MPRTSAFAFEAGTIVDDKYEVLAEIGCGSFGRVYRARQRSTGQIVALKVLRFAEEATDETIRRQIARFNREMSLCAELSHPNLVALIDTGDCDGGTPYAAFEFVPGDTLADLLIKEGRLEPREALRLMTQVLDALAAAHHRQIVHRDLKPANIMVSGTGTLQNATLLDLGLGGFVDSRRTEMRRLTGSREFAGTIDYAAPEQLFGADPSAKSDLYSWGVVLFECVTGKHPFADTTRPAALIDQRSVEIPSEIVDHPLGELLARVMEPDPVHRDIDAATLMYDLERIDPHTVGLQLQGRSTGKGLGSRRQIAVISCRLSIGTDDFEQSDGALRSLHEICAEAARHYGGAIASKVGDRVVLYFGHPVAHENDTRRAARAALEISREVTATTARAALPNMTAHLGVHAGPVITREAADASAPSGVEIVGTTSAVASQLDELAPAGAVLLSDIASRLLGPSMETEPAGRHVLRGAQTEVPVHLLRPGAPSAASSGVGQPEFVDRKRPLRQLLESWEAAREGHGECVVLRGEPGIGKTRLLRELRYRLDEAQWLECRCLEDWTDTPLWPVATLLHETSVDPELLLARAAVDLESAIPLLRDMLGLAEDPRFPRQSLTPEREKSLLLMSLTAAVVGLSTDDPVVIVVEDLHWSDPTTRDLIDLVVQRIQSEVDLRLLLILSTRDWIPPAASVIQLSSLTEDEVLQMVRRQVPGDRAPSAEVMRRVAERSDGVPLFIEEVTRVLIESDDVLGDELVPDSLGALLQARLDKLSDATREITQFASAIGREFDVDLLRSVTRTSDGALRASLTEMIRAGIVISRPSAAGERYAFKHALLRDTAWNSMLTETRRRCHGRIVDQLERDLPRITEDEPEILAHHLGHAGQFSRAASMWNIAGRRALTRAAYPEGISRLEKGLQVVSLLEESNARLQLEALLLENLGMAYYSTLGYGDEKVEEVFSRAEAICNELGHSVQLQTLYGIWGVRFNRGAVDETAVLVKRFVDMAEHSKEPLAALYAHGCSGLRAGMLGELDFADEQLELSTRECEAPSNAVHLDRLPYGGPVHPPGWWSWVRLMRGHPNGAREIRDRMRTLAERLGKAHGHALSGHFSALLAAELDDVDSALELTEKQIAFSAEQHILLWQLCSQVIHGWATARSGDPSTGLAEISTSMAILDQVGMVTTNSVFLAFRAEAEMLCNDFERATASVREGLAMADHTLDHFYLGPLHRIGGQILLAQGDRDGAEIALRRSLAITQEQGARWYRLRSANELAQVLGESNRSREGHALVAEALGGVDEGGDTAPVRRARALLEQLG